MTDTYFALTQTAKRSEWISRLARYALGARTGAAVAIDKMERLGAELRREFQLELLRETLQRARRTAYGRGRALDVRQWPVLTKEQLRTNPEEFRLARCWPRVPAATSGTTGQPLRIWRGLGSITAEQTFLDRLVQPIGLSFKNARIAILRGNAPKPLRNGTLAIAERTSARRLWLSTTQLSPRTFDAYYSALRSFAPDILWVYPSAGDVLAGLCLDRKVKIPVRVTLSSSEMLSDSAMQRMTTTFGSPVIDYYGQAERTCMSVRRAAGHSYFQPAYGHVELVPVQLADAPAHMAHARIIATGFWNDAMPLVRYDTGDIIEYDAAYGDDELTMVSLGLKPFHRVLGRQPQHLIAPEGRFIQGLAGLLGYGEGIRRAQIVQFEDLSIEIRIIAEPSFNERCRTSLLSRARERIPAEMPVRVTVVDRLETTAAGKTPFIICRATQACHTVDSTLRVPTSNS